MENKVKVWLARDRSGSIFAFSERPNKYKVYWAFAPSMQLDKSIFPSVKWEDDEPTEAYITLAEPQEQPKQEQPKQEKEIDWEQRRYEIAKEMMPVLYRHAVAVSERGQGIMLKDIADIAVGFADILIKKLKEQGK